MIDFNPSRETKVSEYFTRKEFECSCGCGFSTVDAQLLVFLDHLREQFGAIKINSAARCYDHNMAIGGAEYSCHMRGIAADIVPLDHDIGDVFNYISSIFTEHGGAIWYKSKGIIHIDIALRNYIEVK